MRTNQEIIDVLKELKESNGLSLSELARRVGLAKSALSRYFNGSREFPLNKVSAFASALGVSTEYILGFNVSDVPTPTNSNPFEDLTAANKAKAITYINELLESQNQTINEPITLYTVQTVTELAAGFGFPYDEDDVKTVQVANEPPRHDLASRVDGDSMLPDYEDGDVVYLRDYGFSSFTGQVCAIAINQESFIKKVYTEENGLRLVSLNPAYPDKFIGFPPDTDIHIKIYTVVGSDKVV